MAEKIKGITVQIGGETSGLDKALSGADKKSRSLQGELSKVNRLLKFDPTNTQLLAQKQELLAGAVSNTRDRLDALRQAQEKVEKAHAANAEWEASYKPLAAKIDDTKTRLKKLTDQQDEMTRKLESGEISTEEYEKFRRALEDTQKESKDLAKELRDLEKQFADGHIDDAQYRDYQREVAATEQKLKDLEEQSKKTSGALSANLEKAGEKVRVVGDKISNVGKAILPISGAVAGVGVAAGKMGMDFEDSLANINTLLDDDSHLEGYRRAILDVSNETGLAADTMSSGMYQAISSLGDEGEKTQGMFKVMATAAKAGGSEVADSVALISAGMKGYNQVNEETAQKIADLGFQTAKLGVTTFPEMAKSMQPLFPLADSLDVSFEELFGVMATGTGVTGNTAEVSTQLKAVMSNLLKPTKDMQDIIAKYGYANAQAMIESEGLTGVLGILQKETGGQSDKLAGLFSSTEALTLVTALTGSQFDTFKDKLGQMSDATGATETAYDKLGTKGDTLRKSATQIKNTLIELGTIILTMLAPVITAISEKVSEFATWFGNLDDKSKKIITTVGGVVAALGPVVYVVGKVISGVGQVIQFLPRIASAVKGIIGIVSKLGAVIMAHPVVAVIAAIVAAVIYLWNNCEWFRDAVIAVWEKVKEVVGGVVDALVTFFTVTIPEAWNSVLAFFQSIPEFFAQLWESIKQFFINGWNSIVTFFTETIPAWIESVVAWFSTLPERIGYAIGTLIGTIVRFFAELPGNVATFLSEVWTRLVEWGANMIATAAEKGKAFLDTVITFFRELPGNVWNWLRETVQKAVEWGAQMSAQAKEKTTAFVNSVVTFIKKLPGKVWTWLSQTVQKAVQWGADMVSTAKSKMSEFVQSALDKLRELPKKVVEIGANVIRGIWDGINSMITWIKDKVTGFCSGFIDGFKNALGIHSPSTEGISIGEYLMMGLNVGMKNRTGEVMQTVKSVSDELITRLGEVTTFVDRFASISSLEFQLWGLTDGANASEDVKLEKELESLTEQHEQQKKSVDATQKSYDKMVELYGENSDESMKLQEQLLKEQIAYEETTKKIKEMNEQLAQSKILRAEQDARQKELTAKGERILAENQSKYGKGASGSSSKTTNNNTNINVAVSGPVGTALRVGQLVAKTAANALFKAGKGATT